jgi:hypothetical protein
LISYSVFVFLSILVLLFYIPNHYTGDIWRVTKELVNVKNPIYLRNYQGDFNYYFPYFLSVVPIDERLGIETRFPILFTESTYYFYFTLPFLGLAIVDKNLKYRVFILTILTIGLILSRSILGIFAILIAFIFSLFKNPKKNNGLIFKVLTTLLFALFIYYSCIYLDNLFSTNKSEELDIYTSDAAIELIKSNVSMFGLNFEPEEFKVYGSVIILFRYGILGVISIIFFIFALVRLLFRLRESHNNKILTFGFALIFLTSPFFSLKVPNLLNYASLIVVASFLDIYKLSNKSE